MIKTYTTPLIRKKTKAGEAEKEKDVFCYRCGQKIIGEHVYIVTRRRTKMHLCDKCFKEGL